ITTDSPLYQGGHFNLCGAFLVVGQAPCKGPTSAKIVRGAKVHGLNRRWCRQLLFLLCTALFELTQKIRVKHWCSFLSKDLIPGDRLIIGASPSDPHFPAC